MRKFLSRILWHLRRLWGGDAPPPPMGHNRPPRRRAAKVEPAPFEFHFREAILNRLDDYFFYIQRMRRSDRDAFALYSRLGAHILPAGGAVVDAVLHPWWKTNRPGFGCVATMTPSTEKAIYPQFLYFHKYERPPADMQPLGGGDIYKVTAYWDEKNISKFKNAHPAPTEFGIAIMNDGTVQVLKMRFTTYLNVKPRHGGRSFHIPRHDWGFEEFFKRWSKEHGENVEEYLVKMFIYAANLFVSSNSSMVRIVASKKKLAAAFSVDILRVPFFFKDRDDRVAGKRIFHIVRAHERQTTGGNTLVRTHFRGMREFTWNGYGIRITVPGVHGINLSEFDVGAWDDEEAEKMDPGQFVGVAPMADQLNAHTQDRRYAREWRRRPRPAKV